jgi:arylsulfatase A-like enzyme
MLYEGGIRVPGFVSGGSPVLPASVRGTLNHKLYHITDWLPTLVALAGGETSKNLPLDGVDIWPSLTTTAAAERKELLLNLNPACGEGYVTPNAGVRLGDWKLLVECFNTTTLLPTTSGTKAKHAVELYNIAMDPLETTNVAPARPEKVDELMARLAAYANSTDQVPPTLFWPFDSNSTAANGQRSVAPWNYQCPQCCRTGALPGAQGRHFDPWCDNVTCGVGPPCASEDGPPHS